MDLSSIIFNVVLIPWIVLLIIGALWVLRIVIRANRTHVDLSWNVPVDGVEHLITLHAKQKGFSSEIVVSVDGDILTGKPKQFQDDQGGGPLGFASGTFYTHIIEFPLESGKRTQLELTWRTGSINKVPSAVALTWDFVILYEYDNGEEHDYISLDEHGEQKPRIFISYTRNDFAIAKYLYQQLRSAGYQPWLDRLDISHGKAWREAIEEGIRDAPYFVSLVSPFTLDVNRSDACQQEWFQAEDKNRLVLLIQSIETGQQKGFFGGGANPEWVDVRRNPAEIANIVQVWVRGERDKINLQTTKLETRPRFLAGLRDVAPPDVQRFVRFNVTYSIIIVLVLVPYLIGWLVMMATGIPIAILDQITLGNLIFTVQNDYLSMNSINFILISVNIVFVGMILKLALDDIGATTSFLKRHIRKQELTSLKIGIALWSIMALYGVFIFAFSINAVVYGNQRTYALYIGGRVASAYATTHPILLGETIYHFIFVVIGSLIYLSNIAFDVLKRHTPNMAFWSPSYNIQSLQKSQSKQLAICHNSTTTIKVINDVEIENIPDVIVYYDSANKTFSDWLKESLIEDGYQVATNVLYQKQEIGTALIILSPWIMNNADFTSHLKTILSKEIFGQVVPVLVQETTIPEQFSSIKELNYILTDDLDKVRHDVIETSKGNLKPSRSPYSVDVPTRQTNGTTQDFYLGVLVGHFINLTAVSMSAVLIFPMILLMYLTGSGNTSVVSYEQLTSLPVIMALLALFSIAIFEAYIFSKLIICELSLDTFRTLGTITTIIALGLLVSLLPLIDAAVIEFDGSSWFHDGMIIIMVMIVTGLIITIVSSLTRTVRLHNISGLNILWMSGRSSRGRIDRWFTLALLGLGVGMLLPIIFKMPQQRQVVIEKLTQKLHEEDRWQNEYTVWELLYIKGVDSLPHLDLSNTLLASQNFINFLSMRGFDFSNSDLRVIHLPKNVSQANFTNADLSGSDLQDIQFRGSTLRNANLFFTELDGADFTNADLRGANFENSGLRDVIFDNAIFSETTRLPDGSFWVDGTDMSRFTDYQHPDYVNYHWDYQETSGIWYGMLFHLIKSEYVIEMLIDVDNSAVASSFEGIPHIPFAGLSSLDFSDLVMTGWDLGDSRLVNTDLRGSDLRGVNFAGANLAYALLDGALFDADTIMPDGELWTDDADWERFTNPEHTDYFYNVIPMYAGIGHEEG